MQAAINEISLNRNLFTKQIAEIHSMRCLLDVPVILNCSGCIFDVCDQGREKKSSH